MLVKFSDPNTFLRCLRLDSPRKRRRCDPLVLRLLWVRVHSCVFGFQWREKIYEFRNMCTDDVLLTSNSSYCSIKRIVDAFLWETKFIIHWIRVVALKHISSKTPIAFIMKVCKRYASRRLLLPPCQALAVYVCEFPELNTIKAHVK